MATLVGYAISNSFFGGKESDIFQNRIVVRAYNDFFVDTFNCDIEMAGFHTEDLVMNMNAERIGRPTYTLCDICLYMEKPGTGQGGMAETYLPKYEWQNAFVPVLANPSIAKIKIAKNENRWQEAATKSDTCPKILSEEVKH